MPVRLLDVNVLIALSWSHHVHHDVTTSWLKSVAADGWATCPVTQLGFLRISTNPKIALQAMTIPEAIAALEQVTAHQNHVFWADSPAPSRLLAGLKLQGHGQTTDAYLVSLARHHGGSVATLDRAMSSLGANVELVL